MNNRLSIPELAGLLVEYTGTDKKSAERFLKEFVHVVREGIFEDKIVKIKGIGTFKIILVENRESVDVNTGRRILIPEHYKFSYIPDKDIKEEVNKPFSFFETVEISDTLDTAAFDNIDAEPDEKKEPEVPVVSLDNPEEESCFKESVIETEEIETPSDIEEIEKEPVEKLIPVSFDAPQSDEEEIAAMQAIEYEPEIPEESEQIISVKNILTGETEEETAIPEKVTESYVTDNPEEEGKEYIDTTPEETILEPENIQKKNEEETDSETLSQLIEKEAISVELPPKKKTIGKTIGIVASVVILIGAGGLFFLNRYPTSAKTNISMPESDLAEIAEDIIDNYIYEMYPEAAEEGWEKIESAEENETSKPPATETVAVPTSDVLATVKIVPGNRLTLLALEHYGEKVFWVYIYEHNKKSIKDPNNIPIGSEIIIPAPHLYKIDAKSEESIKRAINLQSRILSGY